MKTKSHPEAADTTRPKRRVGGRARIGAAVAAVALLGMTACTSDPGPKRVAEDIIKSIDLENEIRAEQGLAPIVADEECLLTELGRYSNDELKSIADDLSADNSERNASGETALATYELSLARCVTS